MYGTVARLRVKPGAADKLFAQSREFEAAHVNGFVKSYAYRMDTDPNEYILVVIFTSRETYMANAQSKEQDTRYRKMLSLLEHKPEWHDGEIVYEAQPATLA